MDQAVIGGCAIEALVGRGGMAEVYRARALAGPHAGQAVALKRLLPHLAGDPRTVQVFEREAAITRELRHPAIVSVYDSGVQDGLPYIVMEYVDGRDMRRVLAQCARRGILLPVDFAAYLVHAVAGALERAHTFKDFDGNLLPLVHCDLSPSNLFVSRTGEVKLGDFGVARFLAGEGGRGRTAYGKVRYLAPEQIRGMPVSPRTDLFALGAVFFELLTNQPAFPGSDPDAVGQRILRGELRSPAELRPGIPHPLVALCLRCMAALPAERVPAATAFAQEIDGLYDHAVGTPLAIAAVVRGLFGAAD
ncbi:MAG TPA: serine/threonine-protein kinase [Anaeromyxobacteraceae bacterium]|nr:serine/threonine-protein kinase [Anaeromyxobacteraceae bacterium]